MERIFVPLVFTVTQGSYMKNTGRKNTPWELCRTVCWKGSVPLASM